jgi:hypothetical protein
MSDEAIEAVAKFLVDLVEDEESEEARRSSKTAADALE